MTSNDKRIHTVRSLYGVDNVSQLASVQDKRRGTFESRRDTLIFYQEPRINTLDADELILYKLNNRIAGDWLNTYHPFKAPQGNVLCLGLVDSDTIYCMMTFKKSRNKQYFAEVSRMWMLPTYEIVGGYDLLSQFASDMGMYNLVAYVNMSFENYRDYESVGMSYVRDIQRTKWWIKNDERMSDASRRQRRLTENELILSGWSYAYDCGQRVYEFL